ncbi:LysR family transcriptional regulator [Lysinibacillus fusiformis]|uniref:LysR family transcriptional regulator n=1 Tax=Lysinibacillus fusiformis TaxID=28031 RepID=UPI0023A973CE|nr:LysR family transcriptional regulator [Lysinibacillus fusiformis]WEA41233.1 LysR family transcriptional regulator [Lysinibacillus fusiformis]
MDQQLAVFVMVAEKQNFSRAAEELHMTQPAVSQYIQALERSMGTTLLERSNKFVRLNKAGEIVYHHAKGILGLYSRMNFLIDDLTNKPSGTLSIGASYSFGEYILPHLIARMHEIYPLITPSITIGNTKEIATLVLNHQLDIGIVEGEYKHNLLKIEPFAVDTMSIVASPNNRLVQVDAEVPILELVNETWICREKGSGTREAVEKMFKRYNLNPKRVLEFGSTQLIKESVEAGIGISLLSNCVIRKERANGVLSVIQMKDITVQRDFSTILRSPFQTKALSVFLELLKENSDCPWTF